MKARQERLYVRRVKRAFAAANRRDILCGMIGPNDLMEGD